VKRSRSIRLILLGGLSATGTLTGCAPDATQAPPVTTGAVYTNNYRVPGVGYYHAPFRAWYPLPYNHFDPNRSQYFFGGSWSPTPCESIINVSSPTPEAVQHAQSVRTDIVRGGFGHSSGFHWVSS